MLFIRSFRNIKSMYMYFHCGNIDKLVDRGNPAYHSITSAHAASIIHLPLTARVNNSGDSATFI